MPKTALIFGANGFVGPYLAAELRACGYEVYGSDLAEGPASACYDGYVRADVTDAASVERAVRELAPGAVVNLAAISSVGQSWRDPQTAVRVNVIGTLNVLDAARAQAAPPKVLLVGSSEEYAPCAGPISEAYPIDANNPYGISKAAAESAAAAYSARYGLEIYQTRSFNHTGPGQTKSFVLPSWCGQAARIQASGRPGALKVGNLDAARDFTDVRDVVRAYRMLLESGHSGEVFNIGSGEARSLHDLACLVASFSDMEIGIEPDPALFRPVDNPVICCDASKAGSLLGWRPERRLEDTLREMYEDCLEDAR